MMLPHHVVDMMMAMERICSGRRSSPDPSAGGQGTRSSSLRSVKVQSAQLPASAVNLESFGPERQTIMYMMGDIGNMLWGHLDELDAARLANCIW